MQDAFYVRHVLKRGNLRFKHCVGKKVRKLLARQHTLLCCVHARAFGALDGLESLVLRLQIFFLDDQKRNMVLLTGYVRLTALKMLRHKALLLVTEREHLILIGLPFLQLFLGRKMPKLPSRLLRKFSIECSFRRRE